MHLLDVFRICLIEGLGIRYKQTELAYKNRSFRDRESNHGPPAFQVDVLTITPPRSSDSVRQF